MTPLVAHELEELRRRFKGHVRVLKDFDDFVLVFVTPVGCKAIRDVDELFEFIESHPSRDVGLSLEDVADATEPMLLLLNPAYHCGDDPPQ